MALAPAPPSSAGWKDHRHVAGKVTGLGEIARGAEQHCRVAVMTAGVHRPGGLRGVGNAGDLIERQCIHVGAQAEGPDLLPLAGLAAPDQPDDPGTAHAGHHLVAAELLQPFGDEGRGAMHFVEQLRVRMDILPPRGDIGLQIGDAVDDGHGLTSWNANQAVSSPPSGDQGKGQRPEPGRKA